MYYQLIVEKDVPIRVRDGTALCADVFRPNDGARFPAIMTLGPYPKDIHFKDWAQGQSTASLFAGIEGLDSPDPADRILPVGTRFIPGAFMTHTCFCR